MFYIETKDGDKFLTDKDSDDCKEFDKIINDKLGRDASELFESLIHESQDNVEQMLNSFKHRFNDCLKDFDKTLNNKEVDKAKLEEILAELQAIYLDYLL
jgi:hypothetical protein